jgi:hypothetical protein
VELSRQPELFYLLGKLSNRSTLPLPLNGENISYSYLGGPRQIILTWRLTILTEVFHGFPKSLQANAGIVPCVRLQPLPSISFPIHYSLTIFSFDAAYSELLKSVVK